MTSGENEKKPQISEAELLRVVVERDFATQPEIDHCKAIQERLARKDNYKSLLEIMVEQKAITTNQAKRVLTSVGDSSKIVAPPGYEILGTLGKGSMGAVLRGRQVSMDRIVAMKILRKELAMNKDFIERFHREARIAAKLSHNNIVQAIDSGEYGGTNYFVMEFVDGTNIKKELDNGRIFDETEALNIMIQMAEALAHAHQKGLIHRDVKPENIMLTESGMAKLADLGLARLSDDETLTKSEKGIAIGTPYYISPEQIRGESDVDIRSDIYSLGASFYHMVTGRLPFQAKTPREVMRKHLREPLIPPDHLRTNLTGGLGEVVETMMAKKSSARYASPSDLLLDLKNLLEGKAPVLAASSRGISSMASLTEEDDDDDSASMVGSPRKVQRLHDQLATMRVIALLIGIILAISILINVVLLSR